MATVSKARMREVLEAAMEDVALAMGESLSYQERLKDVRGRVAEVWQMADLGEVPEWEMQVRARRVG